MADIKLNALWDIEITDDLVLVDGIDAIVQDLTTRLRCFLGEWFLDTSVGVPYYRDVLGQKFREPVVRSLFTKVALSTPGIISVGQLVFDFDRTTRVLSVTFSCESTEGPFVYDEEFVII